MQGQSTPICSGWGHWVGWRAGGRARSLQGRCPQPMQTVALKLSCLDKATRSWRGDENWAPEGFTHLLSDLRSNLPHDGHSVPQAWG